MDDINERLALLLKLTGRPVARFQCYAQSWMIRLPYERETAFGTQTEWPVIRASYAKTPLESINKTIDRWNARSYRKPFISPADDKALGLRKPRNAPGGGVG